MPVSSTPRAKKGTLTRAAVEDIVRRSYPYVTMFNVIHGAAAEQGSGRPAAWNRVARSARLHDHTARGGERLNNDLFNVVIPLDLRRTPVVLEVPALDSSYALLEVSGYDHFVSVPLSTRAGDFRRPTKLLFYSARTPPCDEGTLNSVERAIEMSSDFAIGVLRLLPHASDSERFHRICGQLDAIQLEMPAVVYPGEPAVSEGTLPLPGQSRAEIFGSNLLEVMQFVFNHTTFDAEDALDQSLLEVYSSLGVAPGRPWRPEVVPPIDGAVFSQAAEKVHAEARRCMHDNARVCEFRERAFRPKGRMDLETLVVQSAIAPIDPPAEHAVQLPISACNGGSLNATCDHRIRMAKDALPPGIAGWSITLYDAYSHAFVPNYQRKYTVGANAGYVLDRTGGIEIAVSTERPAGVPRENWLPINRENRELELIVRIYAPDLEKLKTWAPPTAEPQPGEVSSPWTMGAGARYGSRENSHTGELA
jgi:hypothetical protein